MNTNLILPLKTFSVAARNPEEYCYITPPLQIENLKPLILCLIFRQSYRIAIPLDFDCEEQESATLFNQTCVE